MNVACTLVHRVTVGTVNPSVGRSEVNVGGQASSHLITLPLTQRVQLVEASTSKLQVVVYEIVLVERRTISDARTQHLYTCTTHLYTRHTCTHTHNTQVVVYEIVLVERRTISDARTQHLYTYTRHTCTHTQTHR